MSVPGVGPLISTAMVAAIGSGEAFHEFPPSRDAEYCRGQGRVQHCQCLSHRTGSPAAFAKESAARPPKARSAVCGLGQRGGTVAQALLNLLLDTIEADRYPNSPRIRVFRDILAKFGSAGWL